MFNTLLMSVHKTNTLLKINTFSVILLTISNYVFIYNWGYNGLAMSNLIVVFITFLISFVYVSRKFYKLPFSIFDGKDSRNLVAYAVG